MVSSSRTTANAQTIKKRKDLSSNGTTFQNLFIYSQEKDENANKKDASGIFSKIKRKITHPYTKKHISDSAEQLKSYLEKLVNELIAMETNPSLQQLLFQ